MPKQGWEGAWELVDDLWRELPPILRVCVFAGIGLSLVATVFLVLIGLSSGIWIIPDTLGALSVLLFLLLVPALIGAILGTFVGVVLELVFGKKDLPPGRRSRRPARCREDR